MPSAAASTTTSHELVRFLIARVDDDVAELRRLARRDGGGDADSVRSVARLQADVAAKRRLIGSLQQLLVLRDQPFEKSIRYQAAQMLRVLASSYEWHASYRPEWRPSGSH